MNKYLSVVLVFLTIGCAASVKSTRVTPIIEPHTSISYTLGAVEQKTVGETMIEQIDAIFITYEGFSTPEGFKPPTYMGLQYPFVPKGTKWGVISKSDKGDFFLKNLTYPEFKASVNSADMPWEYILVVDSMGVPYGYSDSGSYVFKWSEKPSVRLTPETIRVYKEGSLKKEIVYNGKSKDTIKFQYREYNNDFARPAFYQDLMYDLTESKTIGFKGMIIDIQEATNSYIKFTVQSEMK